MHDQFMKLENEKVFKYSTVIYHLMLYYQPKTFPFYLKKLDTQGNPRSVIFWSTITHCSPDSPYSCIEFIDLFIHPATTLLTGVAPPRLSNEIKKIL